jgi:hypothetical protein
MASTGIGTGIGIGLGEIGDAIARRKDRQQEDRDKQADALHAKAIQIGSNLLNSGYKVALDPASKQPALFDLKTGQPAQNPTADVSSMFTEYLNTSKQAQALFPAHETGALIQHFRKFMGKQAKPPEADPRAAQLSPESIAGEVPVPKPEAYTGETSQIMQLLKAASDPSLTPEQRKAAKKEYERISKPEVDPYEGFTDEEKEDSRRIKAGLEPKKKAPAAKKPLTFQYHPQTGGLTSITDPNSGETYDASNIATAPSDVKSRWDAIGKQQDEERKRKEEAEAKKEKEVEDRQAKTIQAALDRQRIAMNDALDKKDYEDAKKVVTAADNDYQGALDRMSTMDKNLESALKNDQQAMLSLVANHIGMTLSAQKGARINKAVWDEAIQSAPWMQRIEAKFGPDGYLSGVTLTPDQMHKMVDLAHEKVDVLKDHKRRVEDEYHDALSVGTRKNSPKDLKDKAKPVNEDDPLGVLQ